MRRIEHLTRLLDFNPVAINYVIPVAPGAEAETTIFQGFVRRTLGVAPIIKRLVRLPPNVLELFVDRDTALAKRATGFSPYEIHLLEVDLLEARLPFHRFPCLITDESTAPSVARVLARHDDHLVFHVTAAQGIPGALDLETLSRRDFYRWLQRIEALLEKRQGKNPLTDLVREPFVEWAAEQVQLTARQHGLTAPNEATLESFGFTLQPGAAIPSVWTTTSERDLDHTYIEMIALSATEVRARRDHALPPRVIDPGGTTLMLAISGVLGTKQPKAARLKLLPTEHAAALRDVYRHITRQRHFGAVRDEPANVTKLIANPLAAGFLQERERELRLWNSVLAVRAAGAAAPLLRLPPALNEVRGRLVDLASTIRGTGTRREQKTTRLAQEIGNQMLHAIPEELRAFLATRTTGIKLFTDVPLELLPIRGVPMSARYTTSRMPITPGDLFLRAGLGARRMVLPAEALRHILLFRSYERDDRLKPLVEDAIRMLVPPDDPRLQLDVVDVHDRASFASALRACRVPIMIFDGHGHHSRTDNAGTLAVGKDRINLGEYAEAFPIPPIVILSACETHPLDGNHNSVANAFLYAGAATVVGTLAPIDAARAALLIARFVFRLLEYVPLIQREIRWSEVMGGMLRMTYAWEVLETLVRTRRVPLSLEATRPVQIAANIAINLFKDDWIEIMLDKLAAEARMTRVAVENAWREVAYFTEALQYVQLGDAEHVWVAPAADATTESDTAATRPYKPD